MGPEDFKPELRKHVIRVPAGYWAFVPPPLPPRVSFGPRLTSALSQADRSIGELAGAGSWVPNPHLLIRPFVRREAVLSSRIEGTVSSVGDLVLFEAEPTAAAAPDVPEVANYVRALDVALQPERPLPLSLRLVRELHGVLMKGVRGQHQTPGEFRRSQNWIGGGKPGDAVFVPPPPNEMHAALDAFEKYLHQEPSLPPLLRIALIHYQFEAIHPFLDGNGRTGRLLISLLLQEWGLLPQPLLYLSAFFERRRSEYYERLLEVSQKGAWEPWLEFFLEGVASESADVLNRARRMFALRERYRQQLHATRASALPLKLVDVLFELPAVTIRMAQQQLDVTPRAAGMNVDKLIEAGILREITGKRRNRVFVAEGILNLLQEQLDERE